jgi:hypothetical protein
MNAKFKQQVFFSDFTQEELQFQDCSLERPGALIFEASDIATSGMSGILNNELIKLISSSWDTSSKMKPVQDQAHLEQIIKQEQGRHPNILEDI